MTFKILMLSLLVWNHLSELKCDENRDEKFTSYLIEQSFVRGVKAGEEVRWTLDLKGSYIIRSVRIHVMDKNRKRFRMAVTDSRVLSHYCNQIFIEENDWVVIICNESLVIGRELTISITSDQFNDTIKIDICSITTHPLIKSSDFKIDSSLTSNEAHSVFDGDLKTCLPFDKWFNYSAWIIIDLKKEMFVESFVVIEQNNKPIKNVEVVIKRHYAIDILPNDTLCTSSNYHLRCDKEGQFILLKINPDNNRTFSLCEIFVSGSISHEKRDRKSGNCNYMNPNPKPEEMKKAWMVPLIIICCVLLFGLGFGAWKICKKKPRFWQCLNDSNLMQDLPTTKLQYLVNKKMINGEFDKEFLKLPKKDVKPSTISLLARHVAKNRFGNIIPFDNNLVLLGDGENSYINASFITGYKEVPRAYIATQGPMNNTLNDFWNLVWRFKVDVIVMLTQLSENGIDKCEQYWPDVDQGEAIFGKISVTIAKECQFADYVRRNLVVKMISQPKESPRAVVHMQFLSWTDYCVPHRSFPILDFRGKVNSLQKHSKSPMVVHCSAGVGRTGTYIAIDYLIKQAELEGKVSVYKCVKDLRLQRMNMVQNKKQFIFIHKSLVEANVTSKTGMHCVDFIKKFHDFASQQSIFENKIQLIKEDSEKSYRNLKKVGQISYERATRTFHFLRKSHKTVTDFDNHRLSMEIGDSCARFINAVTIQCFKMTNACILTPIPLPETRSNFWEMLWENDAREVFLLDNDKKYASYWPKQDAAAFGSLTICMTMEDKSSDYFVIRKFMLVNNVKLDPLEENVKEVTQYHVTRHLWPEHSQVPANKHEFQRILKQLVKSNTRIVLQCLDGSSRSGLTAAAMLMIDMILLDETVDPFLACRYVLASRPNAISQEKFTFLYELALECIEDSGNYNFMHSNEYDLERGM